jgi:hypothetical protein
MVLLAPERQGSTQVVLGFYRGYINIYNQTAYAERREQSAQDIENKVLVLEESGLL